MVFYGNSKHLFNISRFFEYKNLINNVDSIVVIPTYKCDKKCKHCLQKTVQKNGEEMKLSDFILILEKAKKENIKNITFFGGEPTIWKHIKKALTICNNLKLNTALYTNGNKIFSELKYVNTVSFNLNQTKLKDIEEFKKNNNKTIINGLFTITKNTTIKEIKNILKHKHFFKTTNNLSFVLDVTETNKKQHQKNFNKIFKFFDNKSFVIGINLPRCIFTSKQLFYIKNSNNISFYDCFPGWKRLDIDSNLNIKTCSASKAQIKLNKNISFNEHRKILYKSTKNELNCLIKKEECKNCFYLKSKQCHGGCIIWNNHLALEK